jgi:hypothetical protein
MTKLQRAIEADFVQVEKGVQEIVKKLSKPARKKV